MFMPDRKPDRQKYRPADTRVIRSVKLAYTDLVLVMYLVKDCLTLTQFSWYLLEK